MISGFPSGGGGSRPESYLNPARVKSLRELAASAPPGDFAEMGVYRGGSAWHLAAIARSQGRRLHLFDTFSGMPLADDGDYYPLGAFADTSVEHVRHWIPDALFYPGIFPETMPADLPPLGFVHADCDQYASYIACIDHLWPRLVPGGLMMLDDYPYLPSAVRAVEERLKPWLKGSDGRFYAQRAARR